MIKLVTMPNWRASTWLMRRLLHAILGMFGFATLASAGEAPAAAYGAKVKFREGQALAFPDFELTYKGKRHVAGPKFPRGWTAHDFNVRFGKAEQKVSWSAGTGDIGPARFTVRGTAFDLELSRSDQLGPLRDDELVVTRVASGKR
jgi:hypothetical protein